MPKFNFKKTVKDGAKILGIELTEKQIELLEIYKKLIQENSKRTNLTKLLSDEDIAIKHILDSLGLVKVSGLPVGRWIDVGSGAGLPLIPLKIAFSEIEITLVDSKNKATMFLGDVIEKLGLKSSKTIHGRAEEIARDSRCFEKYDVVVARALAPLNELADCTIPFLKLGGKVYAYKGKLSFEEIAEAKSDIARLGGVIGAVEKISVPYLDAERHIVIIDKQANTIK